MISTGTGSELGLARPSGEGNDVPDVLEARGKKDQPLKAQPKTCMRHGAILSEVQVWLIVSSVQVVGC